MSLLKRKTRGLSFSVILISLSFTFCYAVTTETWHETGQEEFDEGRIQRVSTTSDGDIILAPLAEKIADTGEVYVWSIIKDKDGNIYAGTGNQGKIFKINNSDNVSLLYDSPELEVLSLALDEKGRIYAGTSPEGKIYKIDSDGKASIFCDLDENYIWCLSFDMKGNLYAGTGDSGRIYTIGKTGRPEIIYDSKESHILCFAKDSKDNLYAGGEPGGIIYKITPERKVSVIYQADENEIHTLSVSQGDTLFAGTASGQLPPPEQSRAANKQKQKPGEKTPQAFANSVYRISADGLARRIFSSDKYLILSLSADMEGNILAGTGSEGMIYKFSSDEKITALLKCEDLQILSMLSENGEFLFGTGNMGRIYRLSAKYNGDGIFTSAVYDSHSYSKWGKISWEETLSEKTSIIPKTRSGNTKVPDDTWSEWSKAYENSKGERIVSPPARFIQYEVRLESILKTNTPVLREVRISYLSQNQAPEIKLLTIESYNPKETTIPQMPVKEGKREEIRKGEKMLIWYAEDPNGDALFFDIYYRGEKEEKWKKLQTEIKESFYKWDTVSFPDGRYVMKLVATDSPDNPPDKAAKTEKLTESFFIDNTPPETEELGYELEGEAFLIKGTAFDQTSNIIKIEYSLDAEDWIDIFPADEIFDSGKEPFSFRISPEEAGEHTVVVKVTDSHDNTGTAKVIFKKEG